MKGNNIIIRNALWYNGIDTRKSDIVIVQGKIAAIVDHATIDSSCIDEYDAEGLTAMPALVDLHVHFRQPGAEYKETIASGSEAAFQSGYSDVMTMPNLNPAPDNIEHLFEQYKHIFQTETPINVHPYASITVGQKGEGELVDFASLAPYVVGFSDDGRGVQSDDLMLHAMQQCAAIGRPIVAHCEVNSLLHGGYIHAGQYAATHSHRGICSESEWRQIERDIELVARTGCQYHVCHISTKESVRLIAQAKKSNLPVTCETAPHYLLLCQDDLQEHGRFKMNPPLRDRADKEALLEGIADATIDCIATDHAPHSTEEKERGLEKSAFGISSIEIAFPLCYTYLVEKGIISLERLCSLMSIAPRTIAHLPAIQVGSLANIALFDTHTERTIDSREFISKGKSTPFDGWNAKGFCRANIVLGALHEIKRK